MKRSFLFFLVLALLVLPLPVFADNPTEVFVVETVVGTRHGLKLVAPDAATPVSISGFDTIPANTSKFSVTDSNYDSVQTVKKLIAYCNSPAGYYITLSASAMTSESAASVIKYTVASGGATVTTAADGSETASTTKVTEKTSLTKIDYFGALITVTVNETDYLSAVTGTYTGTIKIILVSN